jgi:N-acetylglucosaminyldiphosphoundecaprenol N-acetyl-beta-D-mannosaminyltransferase
MNERFEFGPLSLAPLDPPAAVAWIVNAACSGQRSVVVTSNIHHLRLASIDSAFRAVVANAELNVADGWPLVAASKLLPGPSLPGRVAGVDLVDRVLRSTADLRVALLGGPPGAARRLAERVGDRHDVVLVNELPRDHWNREGGLDPLAANLALAAPNLTLIGIGAPKQELLASRLRDVVAGPIVCCGAAIEILAGIRPRAPRIVQRLGLEWGFRILLEPQRLGPRYSRSAGAFLRVLIDELVRRRE